MRKLLRRIFYLLTRARRERELAEEMAAHRAELGHHPDGDRRASFGSELKLREEARDAWGFRWLDQLGQDLAFGARTLRRSPGFTLTAVLVLALGVGLNLSVFHLINAIFYARIDVRDSSLLQRVVRQSPERQLYSLPQALADFLRTNATQFAYLVTEKDGAISLPLPLVGSEDEEESARTQFVSGNYFTALAVPPEQGRLLAPDDDRQDASAPPAAVMGYGYWERRYASDPKVIGSTLLVAGKPVRIVGVTGPRFTGLSPNAADLWMPAAQRDYLVKEAEPLDGFLRSDTTLAGVLKPGVTAEAADAQLRSLFERWRAEQPSAMADDEVVRARPLGEDERNLGPYGFLPLMTGLVLFASCANLGNMLLARGLARAREIDTRVAVGAGRCRVVRQLMTENLLLAVLGAVAALPVARIGARLFMILFRASPNMHIETDWRIVTGAAALAVFSTVLFGLAPALNAVRRGRHTSRSRRVLLAVQVAASFVLVCGAGLMARGAQRLTESGSRLDFEEIVVVNPNLVDGNLSPAAARKAFLGLANQLRQVPGVRGVTYASGMPLFGVRVENAPGLPQTFWESVDPTYFALMGVPLTRGRNFEPNEPRANIIVSESAARFRWPGEDPLNKIWDAAGTGRTVIGVAADTDATAFRNPGAIEAYAPLPDTAVATAQLIVRTAGNPAPHLNDIRAAATLPGLTPSVRLLQDSVEGMIEHAGMATGLLTALGGVAAFLAAIGVFGLVAFAVTERTREIGVRIALGAGALDIVAALFASYVLPLAAGAAAGFALEVAGERAMQAQIMLGLVPFDVAGYLLGLGAFAVIVAAAVAIPVRRALRIDPAKALRWE